MKILAVLRRPRMKKQERSVLVTVVEAIQTRNVTCLAKKPIVRDPHIFDQKEAARGSRAREVTCQIQKWNIKAEGFHPILVANARVDFP